MRMRILNYLSQHDEKVILATVTGFIKTVLSLSDGSFFAENRKRVEETLRINNFPESEIIRVMNEHYTLMKPVYVQKPAVNAIYATFPGYTMDPSTCKNIKNILYKGASRPLRLATTTRNVSAPIFANMKQKTPGEQCFNMIAKAKYVCNQKTLIEPAKFRELGSALINRCISKSSHCNEDCHVFKEVKLIKGLDNYKRTQAYAKNLKLSLNATGSNIGWPNMHFAKILKQKRNAAFDANRRK